MKYIHIKSNKYIKIKDSSKIVISGDNVVLNVEYIAGKDLNIEYEISKNSVVYLFIKISEDFLTIKEHITCNSNSSLNKYKININNTIKKYYQKVDLFENSLYKYDAITFFKNDEYNEINQLEIFHFEKNSQSFIKHRNLLYTGYVEVNCIGNVEKSAFNSEIIQDLKTVLIDNDAKSLNRPILNIKNKNIIAKHSCSVGEVNEDQIYFLQTRGFSRNHAKKIICNSYINPILNNIYLNESMKNAIDYELKTNNESI